MRWDHGRFNRQIEVAQFTSTAVRQFYHRLAELLAYGGEPLAPRSILNVKHSADRHRAWY